MRGLDDHGREAMPLDELPRDGGARMVELIGPVRGFAEEDEARGGEPLDHRRVLVGLRRKPDGGVIYGSGRVARYAHDSGNLTLKARKRYNGHAGALRLLRVVRMDGLFADRRHAGRQLAAALGKHELVRRGDTVVLALPRGGVPVAYEIATALDVPLAVFVVRKLGVPGHREFAMGAIASGGVRILNDEVVRDLGIPAYAVEQVAEEEQRELQRRERMYNGTHPLPPLSGRTVIVVDDGLATGSTMRAAVQAVRKHEPAAIVAAAPVGAPDTCAALRAEADDVVCLRMPEPFQAVGRWYQRFDQTSDEEVRSLLDAAWARLPQPAGSE